MFVLKPQIIYFCFAKKKEKNRETNTETYNKKSATICGNENKATNTF